MRRRVTFTSDAPPAVVFLLFLLIVVALVLSALVHYEVTLDRALQPGR